jgi:hypothetical protein
MEYVDLRSDAATLQVGMVLVHMRSCYDGFSEDAVIRDLYRSLLEATFYIDDVERMVAVGGDFGLLADSIQEDLDELSKHGYPDLTAVMVALLEMLFSTLRKAILRHDVEQERQPQPA